MHKRDKLEWALLFEIVRDMFWLLGVFTFFLVVDPTMAEA
jgi:hypothetical protein